MRGKAEFCGGILVEKLNLSIDNRGVLEAAPRLRVNVISDYDFRG